MGKNIFIIFVLFVMFFSTGCSSSEYVNELENKIEVLESENADLKRKLDNINELILFKHHYDYDDLLDEIESNCFYY